MPSILNAVTGPAKVMLMGKSGSGKTGALASLVAAGYNLRILDTDYGIKPLAAMLTDDAHYPYAQIIKKRNIDLNHAVRYIPIDTAMKLRTIHKKIGNSTTSETLLAPIDAKAWVRALEALDEWKDGDVNLGKVISWGLDDVLVIDSLSTLSMCAYYFSQSLNGRLGARDEGYSYRADIGAAQSQINRLLQLLYGISVPCNVVMITHITWVDETKGVANRPSDDTEVFNDPDGYPSAIGRALSPKIGTYFNDAYIVKQEGSGQNVRRTIYTTPQDRIAAKNSAYLEREYPVSYGLAEIFSKLRNQPAPTDLIEACKPARSSPVPPMSVSTSTLSTSPVGVSPKIGPKTPTAA